ncbi:MAG: sensor histidine kinase [Bdellovibrionota bacterium]
MPTIISSAELLKSKIPDIMQSWEERARITVSSSLGINSLALRDELPSFLGSLVCVLVDEKRTEAQVGVDAAEILAASKMHGRGRAGFPFFLMTQVILEYQILRKLIFEKLEEKCQLSQRDRDIIISFTEEAVNVAATEFAAALREAQDQFIHSLAHDLKTPLSVARMTAQLRIKRLREQVIPQIEDHEIKSIDRLNRMIDKILNTTKIQSGDSFRLQFQQEDLKCLVLDLVDELNIAYGDAIILKADAPVSGMWDTEVLRRAIENLVGNALKYRAPGTPVTVTLSQSEEMATIQVHNEGNPIPIQDQGKIFESHWRSEKTNSKSGWGLGLTFARSVVYGHHGSIRVESSAENGTTFFVELPKVQSVLQGDRLERLAG